MRKHIYSFNFPSPEEKNQFLQSSRAYIVVYMYIFIFTLNLKILGGRQGIAFQEKSILEFEKHLGDRASHDLCISLKSALI